VKRPSLLVAAVLALVVASVAYGQFRRRGGYVKENNFPPAKDIVIARWKYCTNGAIGQGGWTHNYPYSDMNLKELICRNKKVELD
jgi:hypothetical protein